MEIEFERRYSDFKSLYHKFYINRFRSYIWIIILFTLIVAPALSNNTFSPLYYALLVLIPLIFFIGIYLAPFFFQIRKVKKSYFNNADNKMTLNFKEEGIYFENNSGSGVWKWKAVRKIVTEKRYIALSLTDNRFCLIPRAAFQSEDDLINFIGEIEYNIPQTKPSSRKYSPRSILIPLLIFSAIGYMFYGLYQHHKDPNLFFAQHHLNTLVKDIEYYKTTHGFYPINLERLAETSFTKDPFSSNGESYYYVLHNDEYELFSAGPDGFSYSADDIFPEVPRPKGNIGWIKKDK